MTLGRHTSLDELLSLIFRAAAIIGLLYLLLHADDVIPILRDLGQHM